MRQEKSIKFSGIPLLCWDIAAVKLHDTFSKSSDLAALTDFRNQYNWNSDLDTLLDQEYEALILTDPNQVIKWVNPGFEVMTGYEGRHAIGLTPKFLQGPKTDPEARKRIKERLSVDRPEIFTEHITNYRKSKELYNCKVTIVPLYDHREELVNYLALEKEVA